MNEFNDIASYVRHKLERHRPGVVDWGEFGELAAEWKSYHLQTVGEREPGELRVLYLCGPEPSNDLDVLMAEGVLQNNVWAVESQEHAFASAIQDLRGKGLFPRLHRGDIRNLLHSVHERFDIIYIDACGPLPGGRPNTLQPLLELFSKNRLTPLSVLITNYTRPPPEKMEEFTWLLSYFFSPRQNEYPNSLWKTDIEPAQAELDPQYFAPYVKKYLLDVYSEFVTRFVVVAGRDLFSRARIAAFPDVERLYFDRQGMDAAWKRITSDWRALFRAESHELESLGNQGDIDLVPGAYPLASFFRRSKSDPRTSQMLDILLSYTIGGRRIDIDYPRIEMLASTCNINYDAASVDVQQALRIGWFEPQLFCDIPMAHLLVNSLFGIYGYPYFANPRASKRLTYVAKTNQMFSDCIAFDQCRSYFDFIPSLPLIQDRFRSPAFQLLLRVCMDRIGRHDFSSTGHPFWAASLASLGEGRSARLYDFPKRAILRGPADL